MAASSPTRSGTCLVGMPVPEDLVKFEEELEAQFKAEEKAAKKS